MHFVRPVLLEHSHDLFRRCAAHDRIVDQHDAFAGDDLPHRIELHLHAEVADGLLRLDERAADVVITYQAVLEGDAGFVRVAERGEHTGVGHRHDDIGIDRMLARKLRSKSLPHLGHIVAEDYRVGPREVHVLENAAGFTLRGKLVNDAKGRSPAHTIHRDNLSGTDLADRLRSDEVECARLR